jgi:hypothetical protein
MSNLSLRAMTPDDQITISMASVPSRMEGMERVVRDLFPYCDNFDVYLNNYPEGFRIPIFDDPKVTIYTGEDLGARGKFFMAHRTPGYFLTVDDDLIYPQDYVQKTLAGIDKYQRQAVVGYHGALFAQQPDAMQPQTRILFSHIVHLAHDLPVHMLGTGLFAYHSDTTIIDYRDFEPGKIDEQTAIMCQEKRIPTLCLAHPDRWVTEDDNLKYRDALRRNVAASEKAIERQQRQWELFLPPTWKEFERF